MLTLAAALLRASLGRRESSNFLHYFFFGPSSLALLVLANESVQIADQEETDLDEVSWCSGE